MFRRLRSKIALGATAALLASSVVAGAALASTPTLDFDMQVSAGAKTCLPNAKAHVHIRSLGVVEALDIDASGLPPTPSTTSSSIRSPPPPSG